MRDFRPLIFPLPMNAKLMIVIKSPLFPGFGLGTFDGQQRDGGHRRQRDFLRAELFQFSFDV
jgi:hypothetical protein